MFSIMGRITKQWPILWWLNIWDLCRVLRIESTASLSSKFRLTSAHSQGYIQGIRVIEGGYHASQLIYLSFHLLIRFHPSCMSFTPDQVKKIEQFVCPDCSSPGGDKKIRQSYPRSSPPPDHPTKVCLKDSRQVTRIPNLTQIFSKCAPFFSVGAYLTQPLGLTLMMHSSILLETYRTCHGLILWLCGCSLNQSDGRGDIG